MATPQTIATYNKILKEWYDGQRAMQLVLSESPMLAMLAKTKMGGKYKPLPMIDSYTPGESATFSVADANKGGVTSDSFQLTTANHYALAQIDRKLALASEGVGAFLDAAKANIDGSLKQLSRAIAIHGYRDGSGARGRVSSYAAGVITLTQRYDAVNFSKGQILKFNAVKTGSPGTIANTIFTVTGVNPVAGTLTGVVTALTADPVANQYIYADGDYDQVIKGLDAWLPQSDPSATLFFNVDRSTNPVMFAGVRSNGTGKLRYEALIDGESEIGAIGGGKPNVAFVHPSDFRALKKELEQQVMRPKEITRNLQVMKDSKYVISVSGIVVQGDSREVEVYSDRFQQPNVCHMLETETCGISYIGPSLTHFVERDSDMGMLLDGNADSYTVRCISYPQIYSSAPGHSGVVFNFGL